MAIAATHLVVGAVLICLMPLLEWVMEYERAKAYSFYGVMPLVPCVGFGWMVVGSLLLAEKSWIYQVARWLHLVWLCAVSCVAAVGVVITGMGVLFSVREGRSGGGSVGIFGPYLLGFCAVLFAISIGVLFVLRDLRRNRFPDSSGSRASAILYVAVALTMSVTFTGVSLVGQGKADQRRRVADQRRAHEELQNFAYDSGAVKSLAFSPDGRYLATATETDYSHRGVRLWDIESGRLHRDFDVGLTVLSLAFSSHPPYLIACYEDQWNTGGFVVFDPESGEEVFRDSTMRIASAAVSADGQFLVACGNVGHGNPSLVAPFSVWNLTTFKKVFESAPAYGYVSAAFSESGSRLAVRNQESVEIWPFPLDSDSTLLTSQGSTGGGSDVTATSFCAGDRKLAVLGVFDAKAWRLSESQAAFEDDSTTLPTRGPVEAGAFADDGTLLVVANQQQQVQIVDLGKETLIRQFQVPVWIEGIAISPDNEYIAVGGHKRVVFLDAETGVMIREFAQRDRYLGR